MWKLFALLLSVSAVCAAAEHPTLSIGSPAPDFSLPGVDGKTHKLSDFASSPVLMVVFTCNHCPIAQMYEKRINQLESDYHSRGVAVVAIQGNDPDAIRVDELDSSDISDSLPEMKMRAAERHFNHPYLYDGATQSVTRAYGPKATHLFIFDKDRKLRYEGRVDNSYRIELVKTQDARNAIEALLAGKPVSVTHTGVFGCSTKWKEKHAQRLEALAKIDAEPVNLEMASADDLKKLRANPTGKYLLVNFWATWCGSCVHEFADLETTYQMYRYRDFAFVTVSANMPDEKTSVTAFLQRQHASTRNLLFDSQDTEALQKAFDPTWESGVPYTMLISPTGEVLYQKQGDLDIVELRRKILINLPSDYIGFQKYWMATD